MSARRRLVLTLVTLVAAGSMSGACGGGEIEQPGEPGADANQMGDVGDQRRRVVSVEIRPNNEANDGTGDIPVTFAQVFGGGDVPSGFTIQARIGERDIPTQFDRKATHSDGSTRHGLVTVELPKGTSGWVRVDLDAVRQTDTTPPIDLNAVIPSTFDVRIRASSAATGEYTASLRGPSAKRAAEKAWIAGPLVSEARFSTPFVSATGAEHPRLSLRIDLRAYRASKAVWVDLSVENTWAGASTWANERYDCKIDVNNKEVYAIRDLVHYRHARWRKSFWVSGAEADIRHDVTYLIGTRAVSSYDTSIVIPEDVNANLAASWAKASALPIGIGLVGDTYMGTGGAADGIAPMPRWSTIYLLGMDPRARRATLGNSDMAGSWPVHARRRADDLPDGGDPGRDPPPCSGECNVPLQPDGAHQPAFSYLPYLVTGDRYHFEELLFWTTWNGTSFYKWQTRTQAWSLRTQAEAAWITPDDHPWKKQLNADVIENLAYYKRVYVDGMFRDADECLPMGCANPLHILTNGYALGPDGVRTRFSPWQDDFFTWTLGHLVDLGFEQAMPVLIYKAAFPVMRFTTKGTCWTNAAPYMLDIRPTSGGPFFATYLEAYDAVFGDPVNSKGVRYRDQPCGSQAEADWRNQDSIDRGEDPGWRAGEMWGYADSTRGYPSNLQPALATAVDARVPGAEEAWKIFMARPIKPNYAGGPQFAIVPRNRK